MLLNRKIGPFLLMACLALAACQREQKTENRKAALQLTLEHQAGGQPLQSGRVYTNPLGETFSVSKFKYYLSNLALLDGARLVPLPDTYFLIDDAIDSTKNIKATIPPGTYTGLRLLLGVDSTRNVSGAKTGALDPALDMFWTGSTGYIMAKLEGTAPLSTAPNNRIQYHIGGFSGANNALRTVQIVFPEPVKVEQVLQVNLVAELMHWFDGAHQLRIAQNAVITAPGALAAQYADNHARMFRLNSVLIP